MAKDELNLFPEELLVEILIRFPVQTLLRCTTVCKSWYSLITSRHFINTHRLGNSVKDTVLLCTKFPYKYSIHRDNETFDKLFELDPPIANKYGICNVCTCNGLICMYVFTQVMPKNWNIVCLWNPTIRRLFRVPHPPVEHNPYLLGWGYVGLGFVPETNDYKIVNIKSRTVWVYELGIGSWKNIGNTENFLAKYEIRLHDMYLLNDKMHWLGRRVSDKLRVIVTFDVKKNELGVLMIPPSIKNETDYLFLTLFQDSLALIQLNIRENGNFTYCVSLMKEFGVYESWTKDFMIGIPDMPLMLRYNGEALLMKNVSITTCELNSYDPKTRCTKNVVTKIADDFRYVEYIVQSLVLLDNRAAIL